MTHPFIDANLIVRFLTRDHPPQQAATDALFDAIQRGQLTVLVPTIVLTEVVFVLAAQRYGLPRAEIRDALLLLARYPHFHVLQRRLVEQALGLWAEKTIKWGDALIVAEMRQRQAHQLYSFDRHFDHITGIARLEPRQEAA